MKIKKIFIKNLFNNGYEYHFDLKDDISIIIGWNGMGKTTILKLITELVVNYCDKEDEEIHLNALAQTFYFDSCKIEFENGEFVVLNRDGNSALKKVSNLSSDGAANMLFTDRHIDCNRMEWFETIIKQDLDKYSILKKHIDNLFEIKQMDLGSDGKIKFTTDTGNCHCLADLSSGEANIFITLIELIFLTNEGDICLIDDPEQSLHICWQQQYIDLLNDVMRDIGPRQILLTAHSPFIARENYVVDNKIEEITKEKDEY